ncbi:response regulator receiver domain-containing protein [Pseudoduganella flava]|uniref:Response regulator n=1 Tax=Pseudoduganella flava TaxID=871742 RepID=A0A562PGQ0_9BURK|nr:response regulator [Pseudoduganella flava]QGZ42489.1 response regulator [Pseudoduganella flava]TWI43635.1 response regulator receiver domain-containing protein [Pseudoduganella flava]
MTMNSLSALTDIDWSRTDVGRPDGWPPTLRAATDIMLNSPVPTLIMWGRQQVLLLNHAYATLSGLPTQPPGGRVPAMQPTAWSWNPRAIERAWQGEALVFPGQALQMWRADGVSEQRFDLYYTPLHGGDGSVLGILCMLAPPSATVATPTARGLRMLVVEDNLDAQYLVCEMLRAIGHEVDAVAAAEDALDKLEAAQADTPFDVLFTDVSLPGISGVELARRAVANWPDLQVIFASGYSGTLTQQLDFAAEAIQKPYDIEQLQAILDRIAARLPAR